MWSDPPLVRAVGDATERSSSTALELESFRGEVIGELGELRTELRAQSKDMGLGRKGWDFLLSKAGQRELFRTVGAVAALVAAIGAIAASCHGQAPAPQVPTMILLPAPLPTSVDAGVTKP